jgi:hypothetical protein
MQPSDRRLRRGHVKPALRYALTALIALALLSAGGLVVYRSNYNTMPWTATLPGRVHGCGRYFDLDTAAPTTTPATSSGLHVLGRFAPPLHRSYLVWGDGAAPAEGGSPLCGVGDFYLEYPAGVLCRYGIKGMP